MSAVTGAGSETSRAYIMKRFDQSGGICFCIYSRKYGKKYGLLWWFFLQKLWITHVDNFFARPKFAF